MGPLGWAMACMSACIIFTYFLYLPVPSLPQPVGSPVRQVNFQLWYVGSTSLTRDQTHRSIREVPGLHYGLNVCGGPPQIHVALLTPKGDEEVGVLGS